MKQRKRPLRTFDTVATIGGTRDAQVVIPLPEDHGLAPGQYEVQIFWRDRPKHISPVRMHDSEYSMIELSQGIAFVTPEDQLIDEVPSGTLPGEYAVSVDILGPVGFGAAAAGEGDLKRQRRVN